MKKIFSLLLALTLVFALGASAFAEEPTTVTIKEGVIANSYSSSGDTHVTYEVATKFTVTIPASVTLDKDNRTGSGAISVTGALIPEECSLLICINSSLYYDDAKDDFYLSNGASTLRYTIKNGEDFVTLNDPFLTLAAGTAETGATLSFAADEPDKSGSYADTLTFNVVINNPT